MLHLSIFIIFALPIKLLIRAETYSCNLPNVGTVLFRRNNIRNINCWSHEEIALLYSRRIFQELLPKRIPNSASLHSYIMLCLEEIHRLTVSEYNFLITVFVFADVFGGFLQAYGLPFLNKGYYEGIVDYSTAKKLHNIQDDFKIWLRTNGKGWAQKIKVMNQFTKISPLKMNKTFEENACSKIVMNNNFSPGQSIGLTPGQYISLPLLDNYKKPTAIAVPLKDRALFSLQDRCSYDIIVTYYSIASQCFIELSKLDNKINKFVFDFIFYDWLKKNILSHLDEDKWFVGFSSVLQIEESIKTRNFNQTESSTVKSDYVNTTSEKGKKDFMSLFYIITFCILIFSIYFLALSYNKLCNLFCHKVEDTLDDCCNSSTSSSSSNCNKHSWEHRKKHSSSSFESSSLLSSNNLSDKSDIRTSRHKKQYDLKSDSSNNNSSIKNTKKLQKKKPQSKVTFASSTIK